jgi:hypothetical protein
MKMKNGRRRKRRIRKKRVRQTHLSSDLPLESFFGKEHFIATVRLRTTLIISSCRFNL